MLVDKKEFKELKNQGGGSKGCKLEISVFHESGLNYIKAEECGSLSIMGNGVFYDIALGKKFFFPLDEITGAFIENNRLVITTRDNEESKIVFRSAFMSNTLKMQNIIAESIGVESVTKDEANRQAKEEKGKVIAEKKALRQEKRQQAIAKYKEDQQKERDRLEQLKKEHIPYCPHCHSTSITYIEHRKKLSIGRAVVGGIVAGEAGAVLGGLTSKKVKGEVKCLNCGHTWKI